MQIPEIYKYNYIELEAFEHYLKSNFLVNDELMDMISDFVSNAVTKSISSERARWLGSYLRYKKHARSFK